MNKYYFQKNQNAEQEYIVWKCMIWNIRVWGGRQDKIKPKNDGYSTVNSATQTTTETKE